MVTVTSLWLPILLSAVAVFLVSAVIHMVLTYHRSDVKQIPNEGEVMDAVRKGNLTPGVYFFPYAPSPKEMSNPATIEKFTRGPVGMLTAFKAGPPAMGKTLAVWFVFSLVVGVFVAYVTGRTLARGAEYLAVFRLAGVVSFLAYAGPEAVKSIWSGQPWGTTVKNYFDGLLYALVTAGMFGWLWPEGPTAT